MKGVRLKKFVLVIAAIASIFTFSVTVIAVSPSTLKLVINAKAILYQEAHPIADAKGNILVPAKYVAEKIGFTTAWNQTKQTLTIQRGDKYTDTYIVLMIGKIKAIYNEVYEEDLKTAPILKSGLVYVPLDLISDKLGAVVNWDKSRSTVSINSVFVHMADFNGDWYPVDKNGGIVKISIKSTNISNGMMNIFFSGVRSPVSVKINPDLFGNVSTEGVIYKVNNQFYNRISMKMFYHEYKHFDFRILDETPEEISGKKGADFSSAFYRKGELDKVANAIGFVRELWHDAQKDYDKSPEQSMVTPIFKYVQTFKDGRIQIYECYLDAFSKSNKLYTIDLIKKTYIVEDYGDKILYWDGLPVRNEQ